MNLPLSIKKDLKDHFLVETNPSRLGGMTLKYKKSGSPPVYLKTGQGVAAESLIRENLALQWLEHKQIMVPQVLNFYNDIDSGMTYLLISSVDGIPAHRISSLSKEDILRISAQALRKFHSLDLIGNEKLKTLNDDLRNIQTCIRYQAIKTLDFQTANAGQTPEEMYAYLCRMKSRFSANVMVHGDYCLSNILITHNNFGFIDLSDCGPGDAYKDLSAMEVSIARNFGKELFGVFYDNYDKNIKRSEFKIRYYQIIDQFGYYLNIEKYKQIPFPVR